MIDKMNEHYSFTAPGSVYDEEALTALELAGRTAKKVNEVVDYVNTIPEQVDDEVNDHIKNGDFAKQIDAHTKAVVAQVKASEEEFAKQVEQTETEFSGTVAALNNSVNNRLDTLLGAITPEEGTGSMDAEVIDMRAGGDGVSYDSAGEAVRKQLDKKLDLCDFDTYNVVEKVGYYVNLNSVDPYWPMEGYRCKSIKIPCSPGDVFLYYGCATGVVIASYIFYKDGVKVSGGQWMPQPTTATPAYAEVTIPDGVDTVLFASSTTLDYVHLEVHRISGELAKTNEEKRNIINDILYKFEGYPTHYTTGYYTHSNAKAQPTATYHSKNTDLIPCNVGDVFLYKGRASSAVGGIMFFDANCLYLPNVSMQVTSLDSFTEITIPDGVAYVLFQSYANISSDIVLEVQKKDAPVPFFEMDKRIKSLETLGGMTNVLYGKKYIAIGDSFTAWAPEQFEAGHAYAGKNKVYPYYIGARNNMEVVNMAVGGSTMAYIDGDSRTMFSDSLYLEIPTDADYITIKYGINDSTLNLPIGSIDDASIQTFYGAYNNVMEWIVTHIPYAKVGLIVTNGLSNNEDKFAEAIRNIARKWGVAYLDYHSENTPLLHRCNKGGTVCDTAKNARLAAFRVSETDTHPNAKAHEYESTIVENFLRGL